MQDDGYVAITLSNPHCSEKECRELCVRLLLEEAGVVIERATREVLVSFPRLLLQRLDAHTRERGKTRSEMIRLAVVTMLDEAQVPWPATEEDRQLRLSLTREEMKECTM